MEFLKQFFGENGEKALTYDDLQKALEGSKDVKLANLATGQWVDKGRFTAKQAELDAANHTIGELQAAAKKFDGVDVEQLLGDLAALQTKYDSDVSALRLDNALNAALSAAKAKNPKLARAALDVSRLKLDGETVLGLDEQLKALKESDGYLFEPDGEGEPGGRVDTGAGHGGSGDPGDAFFAAAMKAALGKK